MPDDVPQFRFTITDRTFKIVTTVAGVIVLVYKLWTWSIDSAVKARDLQADHQRFKEILFGTEKETGLIQQVKTTHAATVKLDADYGKMWLDMDAVKRWRDTSLVTTPK